jgi:SOS response regulatory protein OraA/RecX
MSGYTLLRVIPKGEHALSLSVQRGDGEVVALTVGKSVCATLGDLTAGDALTEQDYLRLSAEHEKREAYRAAMRVLELASPSKKALLSKLLHKGFSRDAAAFAVSRMSELGYIRETEQARRLAASLVRRNLWGPRRVYAALCEKGYSGSDAREAVEAAEASGEIDFAEARRALLAREAKKGAPPEKLRATLYRYGYTGED